MLWSAVALLLAVVSVLLSMLVAILWLTILRLGRVLLVRVVMLLVLRRRRVGRVATIRIVALVILALGRRAIAVLLGRLVVVRGRCVLTLRRH